jgi:hypothetical protein
MWGVDQLDRHTTLMPGEDVSLLLPTTNKDVSYDIQAVNEDEDTYTFSVDVRAHQDDMLFRIRNRDLD